jgi:hypothetical protein
MDGITYASGQYLRVFIDDFDATNGAVSVIHGLLPAVTLACGLYILNIIIFKSLFFSFIFNLKDLLVHL